MSLVSSAPSKSFGCSETKGMALCLRACGPGQVAGCCLLFSALLVGILGPWLQVVEERQAQCWMWPSLICTSHNSLFKFSLAWRRLWMCPSPLSLFMPCLAQAVVKGRLLHIAHDFSLSAPRTADVAKRWTARHCTIFLTALTAVLGPDSQADQQAAQGVQVAGRDLLCLHLQQQCTTVAGAIVHCWGLAAWGD